MAYKKKIEKHLGYQEIADELGCSKQAVQQCERSALKKLRRWFVKNNIEKGDFEKDCFYGDDCDNETLKIMLDRADKLFYR